MRADPVATVCGTRIVAATDDDRRRTMLVSDLHVPVHGDAVLDDFLLLLAQARQAPSTTRLLILGDLFESVVNERQLVAGTWPRLLAGLRATTDAGVPVTLLHGNRDFMLGRGFARATGSRVIAGGLAFKLGAQRALALHGDELCTNDLPYQHSKRWLRSRPVRMLCAAMPRSVADGVGRTAREKSGKSMARGDPQRFAPVVEAVGEALSAGFDLLIFGHVHTPADGRHGNGRYCILPAFDETAIFLAHEVDSGLRFTALGGGAVPGYGPLQFAPAQPANADS